MAIRERLQMVIELNSLTNTSFADRIGVQRSSISHVLSGRNKPSIDFIQKVLNEFPNVDAGWFITGKQSHHSSHSNQLNKGNLTSKEMQEDTHITKKSETAPVKNNQKTIRKVILLYSDGSFEEIEKD